MNVQVISDSNFLIRNIRVCPGSNNDRFVWQFSDAKVYFESLRENHNIMREEGRYYLFGDSGYTPSRILLTPVLNAPEGSPSKRYTDEHVSTRCQVEQLFGILSNIWLAIKRARKLYYSPEKVAVIITVCAILHNFRRLHGIVDDDVDIACNLNNQKDDYIENHNMEHRADNAAGVQERANVIHRYYV